MAEKKTLKVPKKLAATLPAHVSITFRAKIDGDLARVFPPDDPAAAAQNLSHLFRHALMSRLEYGMDLIIRQGKAKTKDEKTLADAAIWHNEIDIQMLKRFMDDQDNPSFIRIRTHDGKVWPTRDKIKAYLKANRDFRNYKEAQLKAGKKP